MSQPSLLFSSGSMEAAGFLCKLSGI